MLRNHGLHDCRIQHVIKHHVIKHQKFKLNLKNIKTSDHGMHANYSSWRIHDVHSGTHIPFAIVLIRINVTVVDLLD